MRFLHSWRKQTTRPQQHTHRRERSAMPIERPIILPEHIQSFIEEVTPPVASSSRSHRNGPSLSDYKLLKVLGNGGYGKVILVREKISQRLFAMKILNKRDIKSKTQAKHAITERNVLALSSSAFIVSLHAAFQTKSKLFLVLDYCAGGELFFHLGRIGRLTEDATRFYTSELVLAIEHLHARQVVYRDLKPENVLLDENGHAKLADFGLAKQNIKLPHAGCNTLCGTPEYLAPEVVGRLGHGKAVDWWSLGMLVYEMITGLPPWYTTDRRQLLLNIRSARLEFPVFVSHNARDFIAALLNRNPSERLGAQFGASELKEHKFLASIDWDLIAARSSTPPITPSQKRSRPDAVQDGDYTPNFDSSITAMPIGSLETEEERSHPHHKRQSSGTNRFVDFAFARESV